MIKKIACIASASALFITSCGGDKRFNGYTKAPSGYYYQFHKHNEKSSLTPKEGDVITFSFVMKYLSNDSLLADSKNNSRSGDAYQTFPFPKSTFKGSLEEGIATLTMGDSATFLVRADSFFIKSNPNHELPKGLKPNEYIKATISLKAIESRDSYMTKMQGAMEEELKQATAYEQNMIVEYVKAKNLSLDRTETGLLFKETKKGSGPQIKAGDMVSAFYKGYTLDGNVFDASEKHGNEPYEFQVGAKSVIAAWDEAFQKMHYGSEAIIVVPFALGYGPRGMGQAIPPYSTLVFEIKAGNKK